MTPRIKPNTTPSAQAQEMLTAVKQKLGMVPNVFATMAHSPAVLNYYLSGRSALNDTRLSAALREQLALTVAGANHCDYCASAHTAIGKKQNLSESEMSQNLSGRSTDAKVQAALTFARRMVDARGNVTDAEMQAIRSAGYSDAEILEMVAVVSQNIFTNYLNHVAGTENDFPQISTASVAKAA